ncbi:Signal transduction histidine kinase [Pedobacter sp. ok626]|uniref:hybrid sensor histidine kinase/response regulator transcription factor n=1 Tax=Pedobacter sp. ok626 TaxID=1761882 RepID=UPI0008923484|nr:two-component regulator propeller domain-containing protein [Pedobacter sp. ok626]SDL55296.1 Signal transduction histidine kinase [Pedobacter sp. ok626]
MSFIYLSSKAINNPYLYYLGIEHGLSNNAVTSVYQDKYGFMWIGTYEGLNRYDGYTFKVFRKNLNDKNSLLNNWIVAIHEDSHHNLLVGTKKGANLYHAATGKFSIIKFRSANKKSILEASYPINAFDSDVEGNVFIATAGQGLLIYEKNSLIATQVPYNSNKGRLNSYHVQSVKVDKNKRVWLFIQEYGLCLYNYKDKSIKQVEASLQTALCIAPDNFGNVWIGNENGLYKYSIAGKTLNGYTEADGFLSHNNIYGLMVDNNGLLWISTDGGGITIYDIKNNRLNYLRQGKENGMLTSSAVNTVFEDKDHRKWIGTLRGGINVLDKNKNRFKTIASNPLRKDGLISNFIISFCEDPKGNVWIGTDGEGLSYWDRKHNHFSNYCHKLNEPGSLTNNNVARIIKDDKDEIWLATYGGGINKFNKQTSAFKYYPCFNTATKSIDRNAWSIYEDRFKNIWVGTCTDGGLYKLNRNTDKFELFSSKLTNVISINEDKQGTLWLGTFSSLIRLSKDNKNVKIFQLNTAVRAIYEDKKGNFWIGTEGSGLLLFDRKKGTYKTFSEENGLPGNTVLNILEDNSGQLWISTFNGLSSFNPISREFKNFHKTDGLQSNQFNYNAALKLNSGEFLFGGIKGFNIFYPEEIKPLIMEPRLLITGLRTNNIPYELDESFTDKKSVYEVNEITLPYDKAILSVDFAALEYSSPDKISYSYYLEGWDNNWNNAGNTRTVNYSKLREGDYRLRIKSTNAEGVWLNNERVLQVSVLPPWWRSIWAYILYAAGLLGSLYLYSRYEKRQTALKYQIELANLKIEQEKDLNEKKLAFFTNVSHEFRTPLTLIINPIKEFLNSSNPIDSKELTVVYRNARRLLSLVDQLLLFRKSDTENLKISKTNLVIFCKEVHACFSQQAKTRNIRFNFSSTKETIDIYVDKEKIEIALFNLISNAFKFTPDGGKIILAINDLSEEVEIHITDTGSGVSDAVGNKLFDRFYQVFEKNASSKPGFGIGLYLVNKFIKLHLGTVTYTSKPGVGTDFLIKLLKGKSHFPSEIIHDSMDEALVFLDELIVDEENYLSADQLEDEANEIITEKQGILIVDDNDDIRNYIKQLFRSTYLVHEARSGEEGLVMASKHMPDIIITDVVMKELSGVELCTKLKKDPGLSHIPVILLTSSSSAEIKLKGIEAGADDHMTKPFDKDILIARVSNLLKSRTTLQSYFFNEITLQSNDTKVSKENKEFLERCISITEDHLNNSDFNIKILADEVGMSHSALYKKVKTISGKSINEFIRYIRLRKAAQLFINSAHNVNEVAFQSGFSDIKYFREQFYKLFELRPSEYIKKYRKNFNKGYKLDKKIR